MMSESGKTGGDHVNARASLRSLALSQNQATALIRLIQDQIDTYNEAVCGQPSRSLEPFTTQDLDMIEPLIESLKKLVLHR